MTHTTLDKFGRILLPKPLRDRLGLKAGDSVSLDVQGESVVLRPDRPEGAWVVKDGIPMWTGPVPEEMQDIVKYLHRLRDQDDHDRFGAHIEEDS